MSLYGDGQRLLTFLIHNVHPTTKELGVGDFTAEYPGYCIAQLRKEYPGEFFTFLLGPAGDNSPHFVRHARDYEEMIRLAELLRQEFDRQLQMQRWEDAVPVDFRMEETILKREYKNEKEGLRIPDHPNEEEQRMLDQLAQKTGSKTRRPRVLREFETVSEYHLAHLIWSKDYSMIFEPFELYSEYYGAVDKKKCSIISISHGFEHYLTGWYLRRWSIHGTLNQFSDEMRRQMWEILGRWSRQEPVE